MYMQADVKFILIWVIFCKNLSSLKAGNKIMSEKLKKEHALQIKIRLSLTLSKALLKMPCKSNQNFGHKHKQGSTNATVMGQTLLITTEKNLGVIRRDLKSDWNNICKICLVKKLENVYPQTFAYLVLMLTLSGIFMDVQTSTRGCLFWTQHTLVNCCLNKLLQGD